MKLIIAIIAAVLIGNFVAVQIKANLDNAADTFLQERDALRHAEFDRAMADINR